MDYDAIIRHVKRKFGNAPRRFYPWDKLTWYKQDLPDWDWKEDEIRISVYNWENVFKYGKITWGRIVQVNKLMFEKDQPNCPGEVLIWQDDTIPFDADAFALVAEKLYEIKGYAEFLDDSFEKEYATHLEDELTRNYGIKIPGSISNGLKLSSSTIFFQRRHIPNGVITDGLFPILYLENKPMVTTMVPYRFWPKDFLESW